MNSKNIFKILKNNKNIFIETGTNRGFGVSWALKYFDKIFSIEILDKFYLECVEKFKNNKNVILIKGDSSELLSSVLDKITEPSFIFLDAHGVKDDIYSLDFHGNNPLINELNIINDHYLNNHIIVIDDVRNIKNIRKELKNLLYNINNDYQIFEYKDMIISALISDLKQSVLESVVSIVRKCKSQYGDRFKYYFTGSYARNEVGFKDYDIAIYDTKNNIKDWELMLKLFYNKNENDGKSIDAQISQYIPEVMKMSGKELYKNRDRIVKRYVYSDEILEDFESCKYKKVYNNLWEKEITLVPEKHRLNGLDKIERIYKKI